MSNDEKRKLSFVPLLKKSNANDADLDEEMDKIFSSTGTSTPVKKIEIPHYDTIEMEGLDAGPNMKLLDEVLEELEEMDDHESSKKSLNSQKISGKVSRASMNEIIGNISEDDSSKDYNFMDDENEKRLTPSNLSLKGSNFSIHISEKETKSHHHPHDLFIQLNELQGIGSDQEWRETARWIKYEENVEEGADRWGRPHVSSLSFHSLLNARRCLESGIVMLDVEECDLPHIVYNAVQQMHAYNCIRFEDREKMFHTIMVNHSYDSRNRMFNFAIKKRSCSESECKGKRKDSFEMYEHRRRASHIYTKRFNRRGSTAVFHPSRTAHFFGPSSKDRSSEERTLLKGYHGRKIDIEHGSPRESQEKQLIQNEYLLKRLPPNCEGAVVLVGEVDFLKEPTIAFIRLAESAKMPNVLEVSVPVRFISILMGPKSDDYDYHEIGRAISTLMSNKHFRNNSYRARNRKELISQINEFLDESLVLPPGKWEQETLIPFDDLKEKSDMIRMRKRRALLDYSKSRDHKLTAEQLEFLSEKFAAGQKKPDGPLRKTGKLWGGLINDVKRRLPMIKSDIIDGLNAETLAAIVFMYFACFATAITFGGLLGDLTNSWIGISETLLATCFVGMIFHLLCGQPLVIIGCTGPLILFDKALIGFCESQGFNFLNVRVYIGFWLIIIGLAVSAFEGSIYVRLFTRFTQEIFSALITLIYLYSTFNKTISIYKINPLLKTEEYFDDVMKEHITKEPNTALFSTLLTLGTFVMAYSLKIFRNSKFLGRNARRALGDFGVPISIAVFVLLANLISQVETEKLKVPDGISPSRPNDRRWLVPIWIKSNPAWLPFVCVVPAFLVYVLAFMESHISELILDKPERKLKKGSGFHWDIVLLCFLNAICGLFGMPWNCAAAVRSVAHISSVTVMSTNHPPGESPHIVDIKEQRLSGFVVSLMIGLSIFAAPLLKMIPVSVLFGVFLYMGICSMNGVHLFERIVLFFVPVKYHPHVPYATKVLTYKMHIYTVIQVSALAVLWIVNESPISLAFPFFLIMMVPLRKILENFYSPSELEALDGAQQNESDDIEEEDFYEQTLISA